MSVNAKADLWQELKTHNATFDKPYQQYTEAELQQMKDDLVPAEGAKVDLDKVEKALDPELEDFGINDPDPDPEPERPMTPEEWERARENEMKPETQANPEPAIPFSDEPNPDEMAGERLNTKDRLEPIRTDSAGRIWFQEEVLKPGYAKPRGRRVLRYLDTGSEKKTILGENGEVVEEFEIAGHGPAREQEARITLPSYQTGIYKDPRYPFLIHTYNGNSGFDFEDVAGYYGGTDRVPEDIKRVYVENDLCYDIRTTIRTIEAEYRHLQATGRIAP